jgi:hypothetical protein
MSVKIQKQPDNMGEDFENCCLCNVPTPFWSVDKDVPLCNKCNKCVELDDIPDKKEYLGL